MTVTRVGRAELPGSTSAECFDGAAHGAHVSFFLNHTPPGSGTALHTHPYEETFIIQEGTVTFQVAQQTLHLGPLTVVSDRYGYSPLPALGELVRDRGARLGF